LPRPSTGSPCAARAAHGEEAVAGDGEVQRLAGVAAGHRREVRHDLVGDGRRALTADARAGSGVGQHELAERALRRAIGLVPGRRGVRQVVGDLLLAELLGEHAGRRDVEATVHLF